MTASASSRVHARTAYTHESRALTPCLFRCSAAEAKGALLYHYSGLGFAARLAPEHAAQLSSEFGALLRRVVRVMGASGDLVSKISLIFPVAFRFRCVAGKDGVAVLKDKMYGVQKDGRVPRFLQENV